jgi:NAD(P)-dependent dehydrogenase (short-subunit alcohol dehydrogenase family)
VSTLDRSKVVLVSGTSSGIGEATVKHLAALGFRVVAGVRKAADAEAWEKQGIETVLLDVTDEKSIRAAVDAVRAKSGGRLYGLVNNAGISLPGMPVEHLPIEDLRRQLDVNVVGQVALTQACLPLLREGKGRVVIVGSISGRSAMPFMSPYAMSKFAMEAFADSLRVELRAWNIPVALLEPGSVSTKLSGKYLEGLDAYAKVLPPEGHERYGRWLKAVRFMGERNGRAGHPPEWIAKVIGDALTARRPGARYICGETPRSMLVLEALPWRVRDWVIAKMLDRLSA